MSKREKLFQKILTGLSDRNIEFADFLYIIKHLGFSVRIKGDHHILTKDGVDEIINVQPKGSKAKAYQVKQFRNIITKYRMEV